MQIEKTNNISFSGVIPIRVYIDGMETLADKNIRAATRQLTTILAGPAKNSEHSISIIKKLAVRDPDYDFSKGYEGFCKIKKSTPSDFFRIIHDGNRYYLFTGYQGEQIAKLGKEVGNQKATAKYNNGENSFDLYVAKRKYEDYIKTSINNIKLRITEYYIKQTRQKTGQPVTLNIFMESNKKYTKTTFKMKLKDIIFSKQTPQNAQFL